MSGLELRETQGGVELTVKVVPGSSRDRVAGVLGDALKVAVSAPREKGKANQAVIEILAKALGVKRNAIRIIAGHGQPRKAVCITGATAAQIRAALGV